MKKPVIIILIVFISSLCFSIQNPDSYILWIQIPNFSNSIECLCYYDSTISVPPYNLHGYGLVENFTLYDDTTEIDSILTFWNSSNYNFQIQSAFHVFLYQDNNGHPVDSEFFYLSVDSSNFSIHHYNSGQYKICLNLEPYNLLLPSGTYWIEILPPNSSGNPYILAQQDIGDRIPLNQKRPYPHFANWLEAKQYYYENFEAGIIIYGNSTQLSNRDTLIDAISIGLLNPPRSLTPSYQNILGIVGNNSLDSQEISFNCTVLEKPGDIIRLNTTIQKNMQSLEIDTINFGTVKVHEQCYYQINLVSNLSGDINPLNDSFSNYSFCSSSQWSALPSMVDYNCQQFIGYYRDNNDITYIHVFGGNFDTINTHQIFNTSTNTWSSGTPLPSYADLHYGGASVTYNDEIIMIGGENHSDMVLVYNPQYDYYYTKDILFFPIQSPVVAFDYDRDMVYLFCGTSGYVYDLITENLFPVTPLPDYASGGGAAYIGNDTLIISCSNGLFNSVLFGVIDPQNSTQINWSYGEDFPGTRISNVSYTQGDSSLYIFGGCRGDEGGPRNQAYMYRKNIGWVKLPNCCYAVKISSSLVAPVKNPSSLEDQNTVFAAGGDIYSFPSDNFYSFKISNYCGVNEQNESTDHYPDQFLLKTPNIINNYFSFNLPVSETSKLNFHIYDISGRLVYAVSNRNLIPGDNFIQWDCVDLNENPISAGVYLYKIEINNNQYYQGKLLVTD